MVDWTPPEAMVEEVARAIAKAAHMHVLGGARWKLWVPDARAALAASPIRELVEALAGLLDVIEYDALIPESVSYMQQARAALARARGETK